VPKWGVRQRSNTVPLVAREIFDKVQALLDGKRPPVTPHQRNNADFPLRNFVRCGSCDHPLTASWSKGRNGRYAYYRCQNRDCRAVNVRRDEMERLFTEYLTRLQPKPEYVRLFSEIIIDLWKAKQTLTTAQHETAQHRVKTLLNHKQRLVDAFVYRSEIDRGTYQEQLDKLNEEIALAEIDERDARIEEIDIQAAVSFGEFVLLNAPRLWAELSLEQRQRLQQLLFPNGVRFEAGVYRTTATSIFFNLEAEQVEKEGLVPNEDGTGGVKTPATVSPCLSGRAFQHTCTVKCQRITGIDGSVGHKMATIPGHKSEAKIGTACRAKQ
jgi:site-specific DNA recombinase